MDKELITINDKEFGTVYFVRNNHKVFIMSSELRRCFGYDCLSNHGKDPDHRLSKVKIKMDLTGTAYQKFMKLICKRYKEKCLKRIDCIEVHDFIKYFKSINNGRKSPGREKFFQFVKKNSFALGLNMSVSNSISQPDAKTNNTPSLFNDLNTDVFDSLHKDVSALENKFKAMQINLDTQKEQIDAKDRSIFTLRAKIKELEEQNDKLRSQLENQTKLNKAIGSFVQDWTALNSATV